LLVSEEEKEESKKAKAWISNNSKRVGGIYRDITIARYTDIYPLSLWLMLMSLIIAYTKQDFEKIKKCKNCRS
jgi:hypothetical protein